MATGKKSFILYADISDMVSELPDDQAGKLFKIILDYVNDKNPEPTDLLLKIAFNPIKQQLKRDLKKYEQYIEKQRDNGKKGGRPSVKIETQKTQAFNSEPKKADSDNVNDNDNESNTDHPLKNSNYFRKPNQPTLQDVQYNFINSGGTIEMATVFFNKYESVEWYMNGSPIKSFKSLIPSFITNWKKNESKNNNDVKDVKIVLNGRD